MTLRGPYIAALLAAAIALAGCASGVDKSEVEQAANPVSGMHRELQGKMQAQANRLEWYSYEDGLVKARKERKSIMIFFYTTWCKWCAKFEAETLPDPEVAAALAPDFVAVKIDSESAARVVHEMRQMGMFELADLYGVQSYPTIWFLEPDGSRAKELKGYLGPADFRDYLAYIKGGDYRTREF